MKENYKQFINRKEKEYSNNLDTYNSLREKNDKKSVNKRRGQLVRMKDIGRKGYFYSLREKWKFIPQSNKKEKVFLIEKLVNVDRTGKTIAKVKKGQVEYRIGYYIVGKIRKKSDKWVWAQYCPIIPDKDIGEVLRTLSKMKTNG